jgi:hypothetical protein
MTEKIYPYLEALLRVLEKLKEGVYDALSSFDHCSKFEMIIKLGKLKWYCEILNEILPEDFDGGISTIERHIYFLDHYYSEDKDFSMFKHNADDITKKDLPSFKEALKKYFETIDESMLVSEENNTKKLEKIKLTELEQAKNKVENTLTHFHVATKAVGDSKNKTTPFKMDNEYNVQAYLEGLLKVQFDDVRREDPTPIHAGSSNRIDFILAQDKIGIEVKRTREGLHDAELGKQLINDIEHYKEHPSCKVLYIFVYDPEEYIKNPRSIENDLSKERENMEVKVFIMPRR